MKRRAPTKGRQSTARSDIEFATSNGRETVAEIEARMNANVEKFIRWRGAK